MALSDSCFDFFEAVREAADALARDAHYYSAPDYPAQYGMEIDALRRACIAVRETPYDPQAGARLMRLAASVMTFHDTPPGNETWENRKGELDKLVAALSRDLADHPDEAASVPAVINNVTSETPYSEQAAGKLKAMLKKVGKPAYDLTIKVIGDVGAATVKRMLGL
jgi:hypothetical protein